MADTTQTNKAPRDKVTKRVFIDGDGKEFPRASADTVAAKIYWLDEGKPVHETSLERESFNDGVFNAGGWFGIMTSVTNAAGGAEDLDDAIEKAEARLESLTRGNWSAERETGPRSGDLVEAIARHHAQKGKELDSAWRERMAEKFNSKELDAKVYEKDPTIRVYLLAIRKERADARYAAAAAKAKEATGSSLADDLVD